MGGRAWLVRTNTYASTPVKQGCQIMERERGQPHQANGQDHLRQYDHRMRRGNDPHHAADRQQQTGRRVPADAHLVTFPVSGVVSNRSMVGCPSSDRRIPYSVRLSRM